jgi:hypothetical protein
MERQYVTNNARELKRLRELAGRITEKELALPYYKEGWTVAAAFVHLAFWDRRTLATLRLWERNGAIPAGSDADTINDALLPVALAVPPRVAVELAISAAEAVDKEVKSASDEMVSEAYGQGKAYRLDRSIHRKLHLDEIETVLKAGTV